MKGIFYTALGAVSAYVLAIIPGRKKGKASLPDVYYAHRGLHENHNGCPENTLKAFQKAVDAGYGIEMDIQLTRDGKVIVTHDMDLKRVAGIREKVDHFTYEELQEIPLFESGERIPLLEDVLKLVDGKVPLIVELKYKQGSAICEKADQLLKNYKGYYCIESFHPQVLFWYRKHRPEVMRGQLAMNYRKIEGWENPLHWALENLLFNFLTKPDFIAYDRRTPRAVAKELCRRVFQCPAVAWTIRSQEQLEAAKPYFQYFIFEGFTPEK